MQPYQRWIMLMALLMAVPALVSADHEPTICLEERQRVTEAYTWQPDGPTPTGCEHYRPDAEPWRYEYQTWVSAWKAIRRSCVEGKQAALDQCLRRE
jgi:hypothetical protein